MCIFPKNSKMVSSYYYKQQQQHFLNQYDSSHWKIIYLSASSGSSSTEDDLTLEDGLEKVTLSAATLTSRNQASQLTPGGTLRRGPSDSVLSNSLSDDVFLKPQPNKCECLISN